MFNMAMTMDNIVHVYYIIHAMTDFNYTYFDFPRSIQPF